MLDRGHRTITRQGRWQCALGNGCNLTYFQCFQPVAMAGYSIYIYHITIDEANRVRKELGLPELPRNWRPPEEDVHPRP